MTLRRVSWWSLILALMGTGMVIADSAQAQDEHDWATDWAVEEGLSLTRDSEGFNLPTSIAFVPNPGSAPSDPLYFVTELRGTVKVVTNDRSVRVFTDLTTFDPEDEFPNPDAEGGLAGICLDEATGYVFVTYLYRDDEGILRNNFVRFESEPGSFSLQPTGQEAYTEVLADYNAALSHQIGTCRTRGDELFFGTGDGFDVSSSQDLQRLTGKILRLTLDGDAHPENPFFDPDEPNAPPGYVYAYGLRNPYGIDTVGDRLFTADNGPDVDVLREIEPGENYLWDGTNWSIGLKAEVSWWPAYGPAGLVYGGDDDLGFPEEINDSFFIASSGAFPRTRVEPSPPGILALPYDLESGVARGAGRFIVEWTAEQSQVVAAVATGPDGLYFAPIVPDETGVGYVLRLAYDPDDPHPYLVGGVDTGRELIDRYACLACHELEGEGGSEGPSLDSVSLMNRLRERLHSSEYTDQIAEIDQLGGEPWASFESERAEVLSQEGLDRIRTWIKYRIIEPRFDRIESQMPNLGVTEEEAETIRDFLIGSPEEPAESFIRRVGSAVFGTRRSLYSFGVGLALGAGVAIAGAWFLVRRRRTDHE